MLSAWTHASLLKATAPINFEEGRLAIAAANTPARDVLRKLTRSRNQLLSYLDQINLPAEKITKAANEYLALLQGLTEPSAAGRPVPVVDPAAATDATENAGAPAPEPAAPEPAAPEPAAPAAPAAPAVPAEPSGPERAVALYAYTATRTPVGQVSMAKGDVFVVVEKNTRSGWWKVQREGADGAAGEEGFVPGNHLREKKAGEEDAPKPKGGGVQYGGSITAIQGFTGSEPKRHDDLPAGSPPGPRCAHATLFRWRDAVTHQDGDSDDPKDELAYTLLNVGLWHCLHASKLAEGAAADDAETPKKIFRALKAAASIFQYVDTNLVPQMGYRPNTDCDERLIRCMAQQCLAEAEEITLSQARLRGHSNELIAGIAHDVLVRFRDCLTQISSFDPTQVHALRSYLEFKVRFYEAMAYAYTGEPYFEREEVGEALACYNRADDAIKDCHTKTLAYEKSLSKTQRKHSVSQVTSSEEFTSFYRFVTGRREKINRENGFIYHVKVPAAPPMLVPAKSMIEFPEYELPPVDGAWAAASFREHKAYLKGEDKAADLKSRKNDNMRMKEGRHTISKDSVLDYCVIS